MPLSLIEYSGLYNDLDFCRFDRRRCCWPGCTPTSSKLPRVSIGTFHIAAPEANSKVSFTSWWTFVGSAFFLLAFLYDRSNRDQNGTFTAKRFGTLHGHLFWLLLTLCLWLLGASLFAASVAQVGECQLHCTQLRVISAFAFIEL